MTAAAGGGPSSPLLPETEEQTVERVQQLIRQFYTSYQYNRRWYMFASALQIIVAAAIPIVALMGFSYSPLISAIFGAVIAVTKGLEQSFGIHQNWIRQAQVYKSLQAELDLYSARVGDYASGDPPRMLADRTTKIVLDENRAWADTAKAEPVQAAG